MKCKMCGRIFETTDSKRKYCGPECYKKSMSIAKHVKKEWHVCELCGKHYLAVRKSQKYCSERCKELSVRPPKEKKMKICKTCGELFETANSAWKNCKACRQNMQGGHKRVSPKQRMELYELHKHKCFVCGGEINKFVDVVAHHLKGDGQKEHPDNRMKNLVPLHKSCHRSIHNIYLNYDFEKNQWYVDGKVFDLLGLKPPIVEKKKLLTNRG